MKSEGKNEGVFVCVLKFFIFHFSLFITKLNDAGS